jgi:hypothetical protein
MLSKNTKSSAINQLTVLLSQFPDILDSIPGRGLSFKEQTSIEFFGNFNNSSFGKMIQKSFLKSLSLQSGLPDWILKMPGMSGRKYRHFINNILSELDGGNYLEVGSWAGSTACSAIFGNNINALCIDNWSQFGGPKDEFIKNISKCKNQIISFNFIENDFRKVPWMNLNYKADVYMFDGPHEEVDQYDGVVMAMPALKDTFILIVDDFNWVKVENGTLRAIKDLNLNIECAIKILTTTDRSHPKLSREFSDWHNGYFIALISK